MQVGAGRLKSESIEAIHNIGYFTANSAEALTQNIILREIVVKVGKALLNAGAPLVIIGGGFDQARGIDAFFAFSAKHKISLEPCAGGGGSGNG